MVITGQYYFRHTVCRWGNSAWESIIFTVLIICLISLFCFVGKNNTFLLYETGITDRQGFSYKCYNNSISYDNILLETN